MNEINLKPGITLPGGSRRVTRTFKAPFTRASREDDYRTAWAYFEQEDAP